MEEDDLTFLKDEPGPGHQHYVWYINLSNEQREAYDRAFWKKEQEIWEEGNRGFTELIESDEGKELIKHLMGSLE